MLRVCVKCSVEFEGRYCKNCAKIYRANYRVVNAQRIAAYNLANKEKVIGYKAAHYQANKEKIIARSETWRLENIDRHRELARNRRIANREDILVYQSEYRAKNRDKVNAACRDWKRANSEKVKTWNSAWAKANPEAARISCQNRRAKLRESGGRLSSGLAAKLFGLQKGKCACCGEPLGDDYHLDHIMPIALGGANVDSNIQLLKQRCNNQKSAKHPVDFMRERGHLL